MTPTPARGPVALGAGELSNVEAVAQRVAELLRDQPAPALVDAEAAAALLSVPKSWLLAEARAGRVPHHRLGKYVRFSPPELTAWATGTGSGPVPGTTAGPVATGSFGAGGGRGTAAGTTSGSGRAAA